MVYTIHFASNSPHSFSVVGTGILITGLLFVFILFILYSLLLSTNIRTNPVCTATRGAGLNQEPDDGSDCTQGDYPVADPGNPVQEPACFVELFHSVLWFRVLDSLTQAAAASCSSRYRLRSSAALSR